MSPHSTPTRTTHWLWPPLLFLGCMIGLIAWILVALGSQHQAGWFALAVALDVAYMLHLGTLRRGWLRLGVALTATLGVILAANWGIASAQLGIVMGLDPWSSALKMGPRLAWTLSTLANQSLDLICYGAALLLSWHLAR
ncbi:hypothetical protein FUT69_06525 [Xylella taiwanensis]|uniref:Membrane protein n=1 Tax=Xylella taiwanensis TaxID=1444770 RepID=Z9JMT2_9GAMM|nr:hypothetical protein [Xylella taiwanensis]AXI83379.1 membrane protein [Xylella taiwanensis]EWS79106.1 membrane protein [Xylella taiwanensis]MCD8456445.1 hypothetical protein [Xylella taiwanensis]MCD8458852.1 hypothetical protein [Xylella taiwanensis]MCD8460989.1 hypothetical protein [Xylella taiwanensis]